MEIMICKYKKQMLFFLTLLLSAFGYEFIYFIMTIHIYDLSKSALNIGIFTTLTFAPRLFSSFFGGIADKLGKGHCLTLSAVFVGILMVFMSLATQIVLIYIIWFIASVFFTVIVNARGSLMAEVVAGKHYASGNAISLSLLNGAKLLGPLLGGIIVMKLNIKILLYVTSLVYFLAAICSQQIKGTSFIPAIKPGLWANVKKGFRFIAENKIFNFFASIAFFWRLFLGFQFTLFVVYIKSFLRCTNEQYGLFMTIIGIGSIAGSLLGPHAAKRIKPSRIIAGGLGLHFASFITLAFCNHYGLSLLIIFISYLVFYITLVTIHSLRDRIVPPEIRGSAYGAMTALLTPPAIVSMLAGSFLADRYAVADVLFSVGILSLLSLLLVFLLKGKQLGVSGVRHDGAAKPWDM